MDLNYQKIKKHFILLTMMKVYVLLVYKIIKLHS